MLCEISLQCFNFQWQDIQQLFGNLRKSLFPVLDLPRLPKAFAIADESVRILKEQFSRRISRSLLCQNED